MERAARHRDERRVVDCHTGGAYRFTHSTPSGEEATFRACFHDVRPNDLIVRTFTYEGTPDRVALERVTFDDIGTGRTRVVVHALHESLADRDAFVAGGMERGVVEGHQRLDIQLAALSRTPPSGWSSRA